MRSSNLTILLAALSSMATAQIVYNDTQINVQSSNEYSNTSLIGYHVGAGLSYIVAQTDGSGSAFAFNLSATSAQLLDNNIAFGYQLPCYVINTPQISGNAGPLECGAGDQDGYYDVASVTSPNDASPGTITFTGISQWYACAVQSFTYGWVQDTIVGSFGNGEPSGPGIQNCTAVDAIAFALPGNTSTTTTSTATAGGPSTMTTSVSSSTVSTSTSGSALYQNSTLTTSFNHYASATSTSAPSNSDSGSTTAAYVSSGISTFVVPCPTAGSISNSTSTISVPSNTSSLVASYVPTAPVATYSPANPSAPVASYTGTASAIWMPSWSVIAAVVAVGMMVL